MEKVRHHYVPKFYLRNFSNNGKSIGMYINKNERYIKCASIKEQACKEYLYGKEQIIEDTLMDIEKDVAIIIKNIIQSSKLPEKETEDYHFILLYILLQEARVQRQAESVTNFINHIVKVMLRMYKDHGRLNIQDNVLDKMKVTLDIPNLDSMKVAAESYPILLDLKASLIIIKNDRMFITSDNPVIRYNYMYVIRNYRLTGYGLANRGIQLFFPISPKHCIYIYDDEMYDTELSEQNIIELHRGKHVDELNKLFYLNSYDFLFFNENVRESYFKKIVSQQKHMNKVNDEVKMIGTVSDALTMYQPRVVKEKINMPFLKINPNFVNMPLPNNMAGPIRPYATQFLPNKSHINKKKSINID